MPEKDWLEEIKNYWPLYVVEIGSTAAILVLLIKVLRKL